MNLQDFKQDRVLTNVSVQYRNNSFIAERILPRVPVEDQAGKYYKFSKNNLRQSDDTKRPGSVANQSNLSFVKEDYNCDGHALKHLIPDPLRQQSTGGIDLNIDTTIMLTEQMQLNQDCALLALIQANLVAVSLAATKWDDNAVDPIARVDAEKQTIAKRCTKVPNVLVLPRPVFTAVRNNTLVKGRITGATELRNSSVTAQQLADVLELDEVIVADTVLNSAVEGQTDSLDFVWGKNALLFYRPTAPALRTVSFGYHLMWIAGVNGVKVRMYRNEERESDVIETQKYYDQKLTCPEAGTFFTNVIT